MGAHSKVNVTPWRRSVLLLPGPSLHLGSSWSFRTSSRSTRADDDLKIFHADPSSSGLYCSPRKRPSFSFSCESILSGRRNQHATSSFFCHFFISFIAMFSSTPENVANSDKSKPFFLIQMHQKFLLLDRNICCCKVVRFRLIIVVSLYQQAQIKRFYLSTILKDLIFGVRMSRFYLCYKMWQLENCMAHQRLLQDRTFLSTRSEIELCRFDTAKHLFLEKLYIKIDQNVFNMILVRSKWSHKFERQSLSRKGHLLYIGYKVSLLSRLLLRSSYRI